MNLIKVGGPLLEFLLLNALKGSKDVWVRTGQPICSGLSNHVRRDIYSTEIFEGERAGQQRK